MFTVQYQQNNRGRKLWVIVDQFSAKSEAESVAARLRNLRGLVCRVIGSDDSESSNPFIRAMAGVGFACDMESNRDSYTSFEPLF